MTKRLISTLLILTALVCFSSCAGETKTLTCDGCGKLVEVEADSNMTDEWILFCAECGEPEIY